MPENCSAKTNNYRPCVKSHGCAAQVCCLSVASSRQRETLSAKSIYLFVIHSLDEETYLKWENTLVQMASVAKPESL